MQEEMCDGRPKSEDQLEELRGKWLFNVLGWYHVVPSNQQKEWAKILWTPVKYYIFDSWASSQLI